MKYLYVLLIGLVSLISCEGGFTPKPKGYNRIELPEHAYRPLPDSFPYAFEVSRYCSLEKHRSPNAEPYWLDLKYYGLGAEVQLTYKALDGNPNTLYTLIDDAYKLTSKHQIKAYSIEQTSVKVDENTQGTVFQLEGDVPSQFQFFATDSANHFLRGALYFKTSTKNDSLKPVINYVEEDLIHLLSTLKWN